MSGAVKELTVIAWRHVIVLAISDTHTARQFESCIELLRNPYHVSVFFFLNDPAPPEIYPLSLHAALPISGRTRPGWPHRGPSPVRPGDRRPGTGWRRPPSPQPGCPPAGSGGHPRRQPALPAAPGRSQIGRAHV